jgi:hypothetical protein
LERVKKKEQYWRDGCKNICTLYPCLKEPPVRHLNTAHTVYLTCTVVSLWSRNSSQNHSLLSLLSISANFTLFVIPDWKVLTENSSQHCIRIRLH